jgi:hypothetical protein
VLFNRTRIPDLCHVCLEQDRPSWLTIFVSSPRKPEGALRLYRAIGQEAYPLSFDRSEIALKHVLAFFSPREEGSRDQEILHHIQHVVNQLDESFDLQRLFPISPMEM